jgi:hypothetical protein
MCVILTSLFACSEEVSETDETSAFTGLPEYDVEKLDSYIKPFDYTGLDVTVGKNEKTPDKVWNTISDSAQIIAYPTLQVEYYAEQEKIKYKYYSAEYGIDYDELLDSLGVTEESIYEAAKSMVKDDLVLEYIVTDANITLSDAEKSEHLDKYAEKFVELYGYDKEYIKANMQDQLYSAMLYDKTVEFLILNNNVLKAE